MSASDSARAHAALERGADATRSAVLQAYGDVFGTDNGRLVLEDMLAAYHFRESESLNAEVAEIPHPHRAYYIEGQRSVVLALRTLVSQILMGEIGDDDHE